MTRENARAPHVSIVIPCRNEREWIEGMVKAALDQKIEGVNVEVLVADGSSDDGSREILTELERSDARLRVIDNPQGIVSTGLNAAIQEASGSVIVRMDVHTRYAPDYVAECLRVLERTGAANVGGPARTTARGATQRAIAAAYHSPFSVGGARFHDVDFEGPVDTVTYGCWPRATLEQAGLFDETLVRNQDDEHNLRLNLAGLVVWQSPTIVSHYAPRPSFRALFRQYAQYGYWKVAVIRKHRRPASLRHLVPAAFVAGSLLLGALSSFSPVARIALLAALGPYALLLLVASVHAAHKAGWSLLPRLLLAFPCFHLGYGLGFLRGLLDFVVLRRAPAARYTRLTRGSAQRPVD